MHAPVDMVKIMTRIHLGRRNCVESTFSLCLLLINKNLTNYIQEVHATCNVGRHLHLYFSFNMKVLCLFHEHNDIKTKRCHFFNNENLMQDKPSKVL